MINKKKCSKCKITKNLDLFYNKDTKDGKSYWCKECYKVYQKEYSQTDKFKETQKRFRQSDKGKASAKRNRQTDKGKVTAKRFSQTEKGKATTKRAQQSDKGKATAKRNRQSEKGKAWYHKQFVEHTQYAIECTLRALVWAALTKYSKTGKIMSSREYDINYKAIIKHLDPYPNTLGISGEFHIDHIYPLSLLDLNNSEHIKVAFDPLNHRWLLAEENIKKGNKIPSKSEIPAVLMKKLKRVGIKVILN